VHILVATDAQWVLDDVMAALTSPSTTFTVVTNGREVVKAVKERTPDLAILDLQVGTMGGMAITMDLRLDHSSGALPHVPVLMLLDRKADIHLARRSGANGWLIKPLNALKLRRAAQEIAAGGCFAEGLEQPAVADEPIADAGDAPTDESANADSLTH
jgi:DNA-binding response OmpR family regulator